MRLKSKNKNVEIIVTEYKTKNSHTNCSRCGKPRNLKYYVTITRSNNNTRGVAYTSDISLCEQCIGIEAKSFQEIGNKMMEYYMNKNPTKNIDEIDYDSLFIYDL